MIYNYKRFLLQMSSTKFFRRRRAASAAHPASMACFLFLPRCPASTTAFVSRSGRLNCRKMPPATPTAQVARQLLRGGRSCQEYPLIKDSCYRVKVSLPGHCETVYIQYVADNKLHRHKIYASRP